MHPFRRVQFSFLRYATSDMKLMTVVLRIVSVLWLGCAVQCFLDLHSLCYLFHLYTSVVSIQFSASEQLLFTESKVFPGLLHAQPSLWSKIHLMRIADSFGKDPDVEKNWGRRRSGQQRMRWLDGNGLEFEQTLGDAEGQGNLVWYSPWGWKSQTCLSDRTTARKPRVDLKHLPHGSLSSDALPHTPLIL